MKTFAGRKLGRPSASRLALLKNMSSSLLLNETVRTTLPKAKEVSRFTEKTITAAKKEGFNSQRTVSKRLFQGQAQKKLFDVLVPRYQSRNGGYCQIIRIGQRAGDAAPMAVIRLLP